MPAGVKRIKNIEICPYVVVPRKCSSSASPAVPSRPRPVAAATTPPAPCRPSSSSLIAVAVAHVTQCPYCIRRHTKSALRHGATREEIMEAIRVAAEMRAGGAYAHSIVALSAMEEVQSDETSDRGNCSADQARLRTIVAS